MGDPEWVAGAAWGGPRRGHPEGSIERHIYDVLAKVDDLAIDDADVRRLRLIALIHDTFKGKVDRSRPPRGDNHHALIARRFAEKYIADRDVLDVIELHDEAYNAWLTGRRRGHWNAAEARAFRLIDRLGPALPLYLRFYRADNATGAKDPTPLSWFEELLKTEK